MMTMQYIMAGGHDSLSLCRVEGNGFKCFQKEGLMGLDCRQSELCKVQMYLWIHRGSERANLPLSVTCAHSSLCELATYANGARARRWSCVRSASVCCAAVAITPSLGFGLGSRTAVHTWLGVSSRFPGDAFSRPWLTLPPLLHQHGAKRGGKKKEKKHSSSIRTGQRASAAFQQATRVTKPSVRPENWGGRHVNFPFGYIKTWKRVKHIYLPTLVFIWLKKQVLSFHRGFANVVISIAGAE